MERIICSKGKNRNGMRTERNRKGLSSYYLLSTISVPSPYLISSSKKVRVTFGHLVLKYLHGDTVYTAYRLCWR